MGNFNFLDATLGKDKNWWPTSILCWLVFLFGAIIIFVIPDIFLEKISSYAISPTVENFVACSNMKLQVAAYFNFMFVYSFVIGLVMGMTVRFSHKNVQKMGLWIYLIIFILIFSIYWFYTSIEPSCLADNPGHSASRFDSLINSAISLFFSGGFIIIGLSAFIGLVVGFIKYLITSKE